MTRIALIGAFAFLSLPALPAGNGAAAAATRANAREISRAPASSDDPLFRDPKAGQVVVASPTSQIVVDRVIHDVERT